MKTHTVTTGASHGYKTGDAIQMTMADRRWWARLWCWATRRPPPIRTVQMTITVSSATTIEKLAALPRFLFWLTARRPAREIRGEHGEPYLERYYLCSVFGWCAYIHRFLASDPDRGLHDHPWGWSMSVILTGSYSEVREGAWRRLFPGQVNVIRGHDFHRILLDQGEEAWTLFIHGPRVKGWGFRRNGEYIPFAQTKDDYPSRQWWKTAPRGRDLRT